jgi:hypothetical protein
MDDSDEQAGRHMLRRLMVRGVTSMGISLSLVVAGAFLASPVYAAGAQIGDGQPVVDATAADGAVAVTVAGVGSTVEGGSFTVARTEGASPMCWYGQRSTGAEYYDYAKDGGPAMQMMDVYIALAQRYPGYELHQGDTEGFWYGPECRSDAPSDYVVQFWASHPPVYWVPGAAVPAVQEIEPRQLAEIAYEFTELPTGTIDWNPRLDGVDATIVNLDTWVWVDGAPTTASVRASVSSGLWAQVDAVLDHVELSAPGADPVTCDEPGIAWTAGATSTPCSIWFTHSSANQPVKDGQDLPTATLTVTAVWTASWTSSLDSNPTALPTQEITTTAEIPVAEIQTLVTLES